MYRTKFCSWLPRILNVFIEHCCEFHDKTYQDPSTMLTRKEADQALRSCIAVGWPFLAGVMYYAVRLFGWITWNSVRSK